MRAVMRVSLQVTQAQSSDQEVEERPSGIRLECKWPHTLPFCREGMVYLWSCYTAGLPSLNRGSDVLRKEVYLYGGSPKKQVSWRGHWAWKENKTP